MITILPATFKHAAAICRIDAMMIGSTSRTQELCDAIVAGQCHVALIDDQVAGYALINNHFFHQSFVPLLMVHPQQQKQGIGKALLVYLESICPTDKLFTSTNLSNKRMQHLCTKLGYLPSGMIDNLDPGDPEVVFCKIVKKPQHS